MKTKSERAYLETLKRITPALVELSHAAHVLAATETDENNSCDRSFMMGEIVDSLAGLCPASVRVLSDLAMELLKEVHHHNPDHGETTSNAPSTPTEH